MLTCVQIHGDINTHRARIPSFHCEQIQFAREIHTRPRRPALSVDTDLTSRLRSILWSKRYRSFPKIKMDPLNLSQDLTVICFRKETKFDNELSIFLAFII